ncbi:ribosomal protein S5 domain 2-type protein [Gigaspora rosea]|uniref:Phosphomevalonate kinase n=1 Tax=Gigaspora rosea TaxID=44941 RepID=A0A397VHB6_9GLOM|nr:ribosomal protein S5 domain 2-type protein [Gigaspora rosea]
MSLTVVSAPGKVLLTGGYLILDREYKGLVIGTSSRFYTIIQPGDNLSKIIIHAPQFNDPNWEYKITIKDGLCELSAFEKDRCNTFIETVLKHSLSIIANRISSQKFDELILKGLNIYVIGSNDFYSQREQLKNSNLPLNTTSLRTLTPFCKVHTTLKQVHKTGLGSSAAMTTSLVAALFVYFKCVDNVNDDIKERTLIHNVSQFCHCLAQGKVGSGFDVSAAVWGSHVYKRFSPAILEPVIKSENNIDITVLNKIIDPDYKWDNQIKSFTLPPEFKMILAEVDSGSNTPSMVGKVLAWRKANPEQGTNKLWNTIASNCAIVIDNLIELTNEYEKDKTEYNEAIRTCSCVNGSTWSNLLDKERSGKRIFELLYSIFTEYQKVRQSLRDMSNMSDAPIEPPMQTRLLDACTEVPGVVMAGVPGAGGYDAIFCIGIGDKFVTQVEKVWENWNEMSVGPLLTNESSEGFKKENLENVLGLKNFLEL